MNKYFDNYRTYKNNINYRMIDIISDILAILAIFGIVVLMYLIFNK